MNFIKNLFKKNRVDEILNNFYADAKQGKCKNLYGNTIQKDKNSVLKRKKSCEECLKIKDKLIELLDFAQELGLEDYVYWPMDDRSAWGKEAPKHYRHGIANIKKELDKWPGNIESNSDWNGLPPNPDPCGNYFFILPDLVLYDQTNGNIVALHCSSNWIQNNCLTETKEPIFSINDNSENLQLIRSFSKTIPSEVANNQNTATIPVVGPSS